ncbi:MAG: tRNA (5-methylaminomethyl-2-thiouridine)(34)-methyltransferase MnmD [Chitinispirillia bacterium]|nr:tRNA (5-methylaminomethyl-2-thiouridine)(34)-methyltransferase MnmD [Chitinispirillia bacterium]
MNIPEHLLNERYGDRYFDVVDAIDEAKRIHIGNSGIVDRLKRMPDGGRRVAIGETGFGAGRLVVALMEALEESGISGTEIEYRSVELYPVDAGRMERILGEFGGRAGRHIKEVVSAYSQIDISVPGWHDAVITGGFGVIALRLYIGEALDMVSSLSGPCDAWFLDGHSPKKNPDIWRGELMLAVGSATREGGTVTTFTVAGHVRRSLEAAGFTVKKVPGCGGKKEALWGCMDKKGSGAPQNQQ